jgi:putative acetyltransferase
VNTLRFVRTDSNHPDFVKLVFDLDADLRIRDGDEHAFYAQFNKIDMIREVVVAYENKEAVACGAFKKFDETAVEIKRMYVVESRRNQGIASDVLNELEKWAAKLNYTRAVLETGLKQPEAIRLYQKNGYEEIPNFGPYAGVENSVCFGKYIRS